MFTWTDGNTATATTHGLGIVIGAKTGTPPEARCYRKMSRGRPRVGGKLLHPPAWMTRIHHLLGAWQFVRYFPPKGN